jgi:plasmid stabilization system protein ParE
LGRHRGREIQRIARPELGDGIRSWHLRNSRTRTTSNEVRRPRHFLIYRTEDDIVVIGRVLHDVVIGRVLHDAMNCFVTSMPICRVTNTAVTLRYT